MRLVFACIVCGVHYLPPEGLEWSDGTSASPLWCNTHHVVAQERGISEPPGAAAVALMAARQRAAAAARFLDQADRKDVRPSRPARTRRAANPGGKRSKLH